MGIEKISIKLEQNKSIFMMNDLVARNILRFFPPVVSAWLLLFFAHMCLAAVLHACVLLLMFLHTCVLLEATFLFC